MTMPMVKTAAVTGGVDTHADSYAAAALDGIGGLLGVSEFPATPAGHPFGRRVAWRAGLMGSQRLVLGN